MIAKKRSAIDLRFSFFAGDRDRTFLGLVSLDGKELDGLT